MNRTRLYLAAGAVTLASVISAGFWLVVVNNSDDRYAKCRRNGVIGSETTIGGPFTLVDETGQTVTEQDVFTRPALVYFGYTNCPDVCPLDVVRNAEAIDILQKRGLDIRPVFITNDPARDTPEVLAEYTAQIHPDMLGLTGTPDQIKAVSWTYKTYYEARHDDNDDVPHENQSDDHSHGDAYLVDHTAISYLVLPNSGFEAFYRREEFAEDLAASAGCYLARLG
jgi:protein SCO1/2